MKKIMFCLAIIGTVGNASCMTPQTVAGTVGAAGASLWVVSKVGEAATDKWGQNRPDWMRNTGVYTTTQKVGEFTVMLGEAVSFLWQKNKEKPKEV